ncbi:unnamed protein product [Paramecium octaurelia]|uniref:Uncharacterized protein n=1 Tax=Paramecium octaurelia TaxID=43137 RepID=A0A8S1TFD0_PAROT|nr:unnamed protein product [Paramecium octaurelia]
MGGKVTTVEQKSQVSEGIKKENSSQQTARLNNYSFISQKNVKITTITEQGVNNLTQYNERDSQISNQVQSQDSSHRIQEQQVQENDGVNQVQNNDQNYNKTSLFEGGECMGEAPVFNGENTKTNQSTLSGIKEHYYPWLIDRLEQFGQYVPPEKFEDLESIKVNTTDLPDKSKYEGFMKNGKMHGYGTNLLEKELFEGSFQNGIRKGWGRSITEDSLISGFWENGKVEKMMEMQTPDLYYKGECKKQIPNGQGELKKPTLYYKGEFLNGRMHGKGVLEDNQKKIKYEGEFALDKYHGNGTYFFSSGKKYVGQFKNSQFNGSGELFSPNNIYYKGQFVDGLFDGWGYHIDQEQTIYDGYWKKGKKNGKGKLTSKQIEVQGIWQDDIFKEND